jgi:protoporphyrinogen IX oxidase
MEGFLYIKATHIIFIVTWFAGLFYIVRLFIYHAEADQKIEPERSILIKQYKIMEKRLWYGITWPSAIITLIMGIMLLHYYDFRVFNWLWIKLGLVAGLYLYHFICHHIFKKFQKDQIITGSQTLRIWNEIATIFLIAIVFIVILKTTEGMLWGIAGLLVISVLLMAAIIAYKKIRQKSEDQ